MKLVGSVDIESEDLVCLSSCSIELDLEDLVRDASVDAQGLQMLLELKEQIDVISSSKERCLFPDFCVVVI